MTLIGEINKWDSNLELPFYNYNFNSIHDILKYKEKNFFRQFSPTAGPAHPGFWDRLESWLENVDDEKDRKALFEFTLNIHFITSDDFKQLFLSAFSGPIKRWIIDLHDIAFDQQLKVNLNLQLYEHTWYGSVTDMNIGDFYRINSISGADVRPDFNTLIKLGDSKKIDKYISDNNIVQIVSVEDFIGSGSQFIKILRRAPKCFVNIPILFVPLLICSNGLNEISNFLGNRRNWSVEPIIVIDDDDRLTTGTDLSGKPLESRIISIAQEFSHRTKGAVVEEWVYGHENTGTLIVLHSNTPDNTLPFIWYTNNWNALFPRSPRT